MTPFLWKRCFLTWLKKWVLLTVFLKSCVSWKHYFYSVFSKTQFFKNKNCMLKKTENLWKIVGCFWTWQNGVFWGFVFEVLILKVCFWCVWYCFKSVKNACFFPSFGFFSGVAHCCSSGFGRFRCFCVSCVCFFLSWFCFCFVCFVLGFVVWCCCFVFLVCFFWLFFWLFCFLFFFGGFKGHVRWPEGPPHLALNPPYFICFCFFCFPLFCFIFCLFFVFFCLFFGGFKGQVRWPKGPPHLALNPPYFISFCFFVFCFLFFFGCFFLVFASARKKPSFPL